MVAAVAGLAACGGDDTAATGSGGSGGSGGAGTAGSAGKGGAATTTTTGTAGKAGSAGSSNGGSAGMGGSGTDAAPDSKIDAPIDATGDCGVAGVSHTAPTVPSAIAPPAGVTLVGGYHASGSQIYTCTASAGDAGTGTWVNTAVADVYGDNCSVFAKHSYTSGPAPTWMSTADGSAVVGSRVAAVAAPGGSDAGDAGPTAITWVLLKAASNSGEGVFTNVTYVNRVDTAGGVGPSGACDPTMDSGKVVNVPYTATYYFYTGGNAADGGTDASSDGSTPVEAAAEAAPEAASTTDSATEASAD